MPVDYFFIDSHFYDYYFYVFRDQKCNLHRMSYEMHDGLLMQKIIASDSCKPHRHQTTAEQMMS
jgi:hypothetical protein